MAGAGVPASAIAAGEAPPLDGTGGFTASAGTDLAAPFPGGAGSLLAGSAAGAAGVVATCSLASAGFIRTGTGAADAGAIAGAGEAGTAVDVGIDFGAIAGLEVVAVRAGDTAADAAGEVCAADGFAGSIFIKFWHLPQRSRKAVLGNRASSTGSGEPH